MMLPPWKESFDKPRQHIKKQWHHFTDKGLYSQSYGFSSSHVQKWELYYEEGWVSKDWYFQIVVDALLCVHAVISVMSCFNATLSSCPTLSFPHYVHKSVLYVCISIATLQKAHHYHLSIFHIYALIYDISFSLTYFCIIGSRFIHLTRPDLHVFLLMWTILSFYQICHNIASFHALVLWLWGTWDPTSPIRNQNCTLCIGRWFPNHWTARKVPTYFKESFSNYRSEIKGLKIKQS